MSGNPSTSDRESNTLDTLVIGAGLSGLSCAVRLHEAGRSVLVLEASDGVGGRVRTDKVDSFLLDRGFQVFLDAYPEATRFLDVKALDLRPFEPGALVWKRGKFQTVMDVFRRPFSILTSATAPIGTVRDKLLVAKLRFHLLQKPISEIWSSPEMTTLEYLQQFGFSDRMIDDFFRGFYGGIFLEDALTTSSRIFEFTFKMFTQGSATLPARGMQAIPEQLAARLPKDGIRYQEAVLSIDQTSATTASRYYEARHLVIATDAENSRQLNAGIAPTQWNSTACFYYAADSSPINAPIIALKGDREGLINNICVPSDVSPDYAPTGKSLVCVSVLGKPELDDDLARRVHDELIDWFGEETRHWKLLRKELIRKALPVAPPGHLEDPAQSGPVFRIGDFTTSGSIEGAMISGLRTADRILQNSGTDSAPEQTASSDSQDQSFRSATN